MSEHTHASYPGSGLARCGGSPGAHTVAPGEPFTCEECRVRLFLAAVRAAYGERRAEGLPPPVKLSIGEQAWCRFLASQSWRLSRAADHADQPTKIFGVPVDVKVSLLDEWHLLDGDGERVAGGEV